MAETKGIAPGYGKSLHIDLSTGKIIQRDIDPDFARGFVGGMGFSCKILYDEAGPDVDPYSPHNPVIIANGPLTGTNVVCAARAEITTKHPLTGHLGTGNTGGSWPTALKRAGFDLVVIRGRAATPVYLRIDDGECELRDATHLWGKTTYETSSTLEQELNSSAPSRVSVLAIGPAGENRVRFACAINDYYHCAARNGAGAVLGDKKLKAIAVRGTGVVKAARPKEFEEAVREARQRALEYKKVHIMWGTDGAHNSIPEGPAYFPTRNYQSGVVPNWGGTRDVGSAYPYVTGALAPCHACPSPCFQGAEVKEGKYAGVRISRATHPGIIMEWGAKCAVDNLPAIWKCKQLCHQFGMDYPSSAGVIAFAMELFERGILSAKDTDGLELTWGNDDAIVQLLHKIAHRDGFGGLLADGSVRAANAIGRGSEKYVMVTKGMEMSGTDPRSGGKGWTLGDLTSPRGGDNVKSTHFRAEIYEPLWWVDKFDMFEDVKKKAYDVPGVPPQELAHTWEGKPTMVKWFEDMYTMANALGVCFFPVGMGPILGPTLFSKLYSAFTGWDTTPEDIVMLAEKVFAVAKAYITRQGLTRKDDSWPERFYTEPLPDGPSKGAMVSREEISRVLDEYYELRGWDKSTGLLTEEKLTALGLADIAEELRVLGKLPGKEDVASS